MPVRPSLARSVVVSLVAVLATLLVPTVPAWAADQLVIKLTVPWASPVISGPTDIGFSVSAVGGPRLRRATVSIGSTSASQAVDPEQCQIACALDSALDVTSIADGPVSLRVTIELVDGSEQHADFPLVVQNAPSVYVTRPSVSEKLTADQQLKVLAYTEPHAGAEIASVSWHDEHGTVAFVPHTEPGDLSGAQWMALVDTSGLAEGEYVGTVTATDTAGRVSSTASAPYTVLRTLRLTPVQAPSGDVNELDLRTFTLRYTYAAAVRDLRPIRAEIDVDGSTVAYDSKLKITGVNEADNAGTIEIDNNYRLPTGHHRVMITLDDDRGAPASIFYDVTVRTLVSASWTSGADATGVVAGTVHHLTAQVSTFGVDVVGCRYQLDNNKATWPATCDRAADGTWRATADVGLADVDLASIGVHRVTLIVQLARGAASYTLPTTVTVIPQTTGRIIDAPAIVGQPFTLVGEVTRTGGGPAAGVSVVLQTRASLTKPWTEIGHGRTGEDGRISLPVVSNRSAEHRLVTKANPGIWGGQSGPATFVAVRATVKVASRPTSLKSGKYMTVKAVTLPGDKGAPMVLQAAPPGTGTWSNVDSGRTTKGGKVTLRHKLTRSTTYRVVRKTDTTTNGSTSPQFTVRAK